jgi:glycine cleavage system regulatory protein
VQRLLLCWQTNKFSSFCSLSAAVRAEVILFNFCAYLHQQFFNWANVWAKEYILPAQQQSLFVASNFPDKPLNQNESQLNNTLLLIKKHQKLKLTGEQSFTIPSFL